MGLGLSQLLASSWGWDGSWLPSPAQTDFHGESPRAQHQPTCCSDTGMGQRNWISLKLMWQEWDGQYLLLGLPTLSSNERTEFYWAEVTTTSRWECEPSSVRWDPKCCKAMQFMLVTQQIHYEFKERFSRLGDVLLTVLRWTFLKLFWKTYKKHVQKSYEKRKGLRWFILTLKEEQMEVLRGFPIVKSIDLLNDRAHLRRLSLCKKVLLGTFVLQEKKLCT